MAPPVVAFIAGSLAFAGTTYAFKKYVYDTHLAEWTEDMVRELRGKLDKSPKKDPHLARPHFTDVDSTRYPKGRSTATAIVPDEAFFGASGDYELRRRGRAEPSLPQEEQWIRAELAREEHEARRGTVSFGSDIVREGRKNGREEEDPFSDENAVKVSQPREKPAGLDLFNAWDQGASRSFSNASTRPGSPPPPVALQTEEQPSGKSGGLGFSQPHAAQPTLLSISSARPSTLEPPPLIDLSHHMHPTPGSELLFHHSDIASPGSPGGWTESLSDVQSAKGNHQLRAGLTTRSPVHQPISPFSVTTAFSDVGFHSPSEEDYGVMSLASLRSVEGAAGPSGIGINQAHESSVPSDTDNVAYQPVKTLSYDPTAPEDTFRQMDIYLPGQSSSKLVLFVHGGAWGTGDKSEHANIPSLLSSASHASPSSPPILAIPNYRLSKRPAHPDNDAVHPSPILDIARSLAFLSQSSAAGGSSALGALEEAKEIYLVGHSCGAHILSFIAFNHPMIRSSLSSTDYANFQITLRKVRGYAWLDGIYDLTDLVDEYPDYEGFVEGAFPGGKLARKAGSIPGLGTMPPPAMLALPHVVAHSRDDQLLTFRQSKVWAVFLRTQGVDQVAWDEETLRGTHDGCLLHEGLGRLVYRLMEE